MKKKPTNYAFIYQIKYHPRFDWFPLNVTALPHHASAAIGLGFKLKVEGSIYSTKEVCQPSQEEELFIIWHEMAWLDEKWQ